MQSSRVGMMSYLIFIVTLLCVILYCSFSEQKGDQCLNEYAKAFESVDKKYSIALQQYGKTLHETSRQKRKNNVVIVDVSVGITGHSPIFHHMLQLNVSSIDRKGNPNYNCQHDSERRKSVKMLFENNQMIYQHTDDKWLSSVVDFPNVKLLFNNFTDEELFANRLHSICSDRTRTNYPPQCYVPVLHIDSFDHRNLKTKLLLNDLSYEKVKAMLTAYRKLISCVVPEKQLFTFNLNQMTPLDYWTKLTKFLSINVSPALFTHLVEGGLHAPLRNREVCFGERPGCPSNAAEIAPSVCDDPSQLLPSDIASRLAVCAGEYSDSIASIFGNKFRSLIYDRLMGSANVLRRAPIDTTRIVLNPAPGTTATTSLFTTMMQLNFTSRHHAAYSSNCSNANLGVRSAIDSDLKVLSMYDSGGVFWADTPMSERWWHVFKMYPKTKLLITAVRDDAYWLKKRIADHCGQVNPDSWDCTTPIAVGVSRPITNLSIEFHKLIHVSQISPENNGKAFTAFRRLISCAVPPEQVKYVYFKEQNNSANFWNGMIEFTKVSITEEARKALIAGGVPRTSTHSGCKIGTKECAFEGGRKVDGAIIPSVCAPYS